MAGQWAAASSCQFPNFPDLRVRPSLRQPTGAVGAVEAGNLLHGKLLHWHTAETIALQNTGLQLNTACNVKVLDESAIYLHLRCSIPQPAQRSNPYPIPPISTSLSTVDKTKAIFQAEG